MFGVPGYKKTPGGKIEGPGTGTSDSIHKAVQAGTYIMPADSTREIGERNLAGLGVPGYQGKEVSVNLSKGEFELTPGQVHAVGVQALDAMKQATHKPTGRGVPRKELFFADGGLVEDPQKKRLTGPGLQAMGTQAVQAARQAAVSPVTQQKAGRGVPGWQTLRDGLAGGAKALVGAAAVPHAAVADAVRNTATLATGGDPDTLEGGRAKYRDMAVGTTQEGLDQAGTAAQTFREAGREALGAQPLASAQQSSVAPPAAPAAPVAGAAAAPAEASAPAGRGAPGWQGTGIGADRQGGEIAMRQGASGVPEFTNEAATPGAVSAGRGVPAPSSQPSASSQPRLGVPGYGSAANVGNGVGTFSQAEAGSSQLALDRFERANQERGRMVEQAQAGELGNNGGRLTVVRDSSRTPTLQERRLGRHEAQLAQTEALRSRTSNESGESAVRTAAEHQRMQTEQLNQQRLGQQIEEGEVAAVDRQRLESLRAAIADPNTSEQERNAARQAYNVLATQAKDRYITQDVVMGQGNNGPVIGRQVIDVTTGQPVSGKAQAESDQFAGGPPAAAVAALLENPNRAAEFDKKFGQGASARYLGAG
jgi:hypothetical protein